MLVGRVDWELLFGIVIRIVVWIVLLDGELDGDFGCDCEG